MRYRKNYFSSLDAIDYTKLTYFELLLNLLTAFFIDIFLCDVMSMTTRDWILLPIQIFVVLPLFPVYAFFEMSHIRKMSRVKDGGWVSYRGVYIYWRDVSDFNCTPTSYLSK
jgi:hypothetical protein